tara:strand:- start:158 stop:685 length:528 start_codon:yes stop_codon:yes gene_type:complete
MFKYIDDRIEEFVRYDRLRLLFALLIKHEVEVRIEIVAKRSPVNPKKYEFHRFKTHPDGRMDYKIKDEIKGRISHWVSANKEHGIHDIFKKYSITSLGAGGVVFLKGNDKFINMEDISALVLPQDQFLTSRRFNMNLFKIYYDAQYLRSEGPTYEFSVLDEYTLFIEEILKRKDM